MAEINATSRVPFGAIATYGAVQAVANLRDRITTWYAVRSTRKALNALSDRELADIGLTRADVDSVAAGRLR